MVKILNYSQESANSQQYSRICSTVMRVLCRFALFYDCKVPEMAIEIKDLQSKISYREL